MFDRGAIPGDQGTYEDNVVTRYINEHMNPLVSMSPGFLRPATMRAPSTTP